MRLIIPVNTMVDKMENKEEEEEDEGKGMITMDYGRNRMTRKRKRN